MAQTANLKIDRHRSYIVRCTGVLGYSEYIKSAIAINVITKYFQIIYQNIGVKKPKKLQDIKFISYSLIKKTYFYYKSIRRVEWQNP